MSSWSGPSHAPPRSTGEPSDNCCVLAPYSCGRDRPDAVPHSTGHCTAGGLDDADDITDAHCDQIVVSNDFHIVDVALLHPLLTEPPRRILDHHQGVIGRDVETSCC